MKFRSILSSFIVAIVFTVQAQAQSVESAVRSPGPHIIEVDYEKLFAMQQPPGYEPFEVYGMFLMSVAAQQTPLVFNPTIKVPSDIIQSKDVIFKQVGNSKVGIDIYQPRGDKTPNPLVLIIHGGYWKAGDKSVHAQQGIEFAEMGYTAASVNYRLSAKHKFPANIEDIYDSIKYLTKNAEIYNIDPDRIVVYGGSAGGHLAGFIGLAANTQGRSYNNGINPKAFKGIISLYGMHDLTLPIQADHPYTQQYIGATFDKAPGKYRDASPIYHVDKNDPPVLLVHGSIDGSVSVKNSDALSATLDANGIKYTYDRVEGWSHAMDYFSPIYERTTWFVYKFLKENMPSDEMKSGKM
ncbi:MAG: alpha/beta hydrolase [Gammaproteobacteria bacterium]|nr:alpha/beta hydrolase [Gammaproteobacteria bacterium]